MHRCGAIGDGRRAIASPGLVPGRRAGSWSAGGGSPAPVPRHRRAMAAWMSMSAPGRAAAGGEEYLVVDGQKLRLTNPARVLFPVTGTTKADVIAYYTAVAGVMLPHLLGRPATRKRWPDGVEGGPSFFVKEVEAGVPVWLPRVQVAQRWGGKFYPVLDSAAALAWLGQVSAIEVHVPQWRVSEPAGPIADPGTGLEVWADRVVFDLDPGEGAGLSECAEVAWALRERLGPLGERVVPVTSGSKGLHLYVPMDDPITSEQATESPRHVRRLQSLGRLESCREIQRGGTRWS